MVKTILSIATAILLLAPNTIAQIPVGEWRDHLPYRDAFAVKVGANKIFHANESALFTFDKDTKETQRYSKTTGLAATGISALDYSPFADAAIVGYQNGDLDLLYENTIVNIPDIRRSNILGKKQVNDIAVRDNLAFLACGFGIVVLNLERQEIADTYIIGANGAQVDVRQVLLDAGKIYALTPNGIFSADLSSPVLADFNNWSLSPDLPEVEEGFFKDFEVFQGQFLLLPEFGYSRSVYATSELGEPWQILPQLNDIPLRDIESFGDILLATTFFSAQALGEDFTIQNQIEVIAEPRDYTAATRDETGRFWVGDANHGLISGSPNDEVVYKTVPSSPLFFEARRISAYNDNIWIAPGGPDQSWTPQILKTPPYGLVNEEWVGPDAVFEPTGHGSVDGISDYMIVAVDPLDNSRVFAASMEEGLLELRDGEIVNTYFQDNSELQDSDFGGTADRVGVMGLDFDDSGNLWMTNYLVDKPIVVLTAGGEWASFSCSPLIGAEDRVSDIKATRNNQIWLQLIDGGVIVYDHNGTITNSSDDNFKLLDNEEGNGALTNNAVLSVEEDLDGEIWVGTLQGLSIFFSPQSIFTSEEFDSQEILIQQDGNTQKLLETESITGIQVDGANRKWITTASSGVYLFSDDGQRQIFHFTEENSPLLSNTVLDLAINYENGEIFFATDKGVVSYMSDAINFVQDIEAINIFPNPVRPEYSGNISIDGLAFDTNVKITDMSGNLVFETTSRGGRASWNGIGIDGNRASTGVYLVFCSTTDGETSTIGKIAFLR